jgi:hypothetical protein
MRFGSITDVANPSVRPDMGGSGSPSTTRAGPACCGLTGFGIGGLGATEAGVILPDLCPSATGKSGVAAALPGAAWIFCAPFTCAAAGSASATGAGADARGRGRGPAITGG